MLRMRKKIKRGEELNRATEWAQTKNEQMIWRWERGAIVGNVLRSFLLHSSL